MEEPSFTIHKLRSLKNIFKQTTSAITMVNPPQRVVTVKISVKMGDEAVQKGDVSLHP